MWPLNLNTYRFMLREVSKRFKTIRYTEIDTSRDFVLWRHDCDMSLNRARHIAEIDAENGITSTFFILPHSEFYNILELEQTRIIREIRDLGHDIGLHLDIGYHTATAKTFDLESAIKRDKYLLEDVTESKIQSFSFHNPTPEMLKLNSKEYAGLINCYSKQIWTTIKYGSDSNGYWRHQPIPEILLDSTNSRIQILTHPDWWIEGDYSPRDRVLRCAYGRARKVMFDYDSAMATYLERDNAKPNDLSITDYDRAMKTMQTRT